ncbi:glycosyltransferase family 9 protein [Buttiauxella gaviniae]|uniref:glycosyltransferase family 9 protein n=1 Tax=Buttiauxella gaviniae TaxID=82990 RepID=UPI000A7B8811
MTTFMHPKKILVINVARFGDTLLITPILRALKKKWPEASLDVFAHRKTASILENSLYINSIKPFSKNKAVWAKIFAQKQYDLAIVYGTDKALVDYAKCVSSMTVSFSHESGDSHWLTVAPPERLMSAQQERALLVEAIGVTISEWQLDYVATADEIQVAKEFLTQQGITDKKLIGFQLQSFPAKSYRDWPVRYFEEIAHRICKEWPNSHILLLGGPEGKSAADALAQKLGSIATSLAGKLTMRQNAAVMTQLSLYLGVDTGPTHLAGALGIPMVAMYHCFHPGRYLAPQQHPQLIVIEHPVDYAHASREEPMSKISIETVWTALKALLSKSNQ